MTFAVRIGENFAAIVVFALRFRYLVIFPIYSVLQRLDIDSSRVIPSVGVLDRVTIAL